MDPTTASQLLLKIVRKRYSENYIDYSIIGLNKYRSYQSAALGPGQWGLLRNQALDPSSNLSRANFLFKVFSAIFPQLQCGEEISAIIVTDDYLWYKEPNSTYNFFLILIFNELFKFQTSDEWQH